MALRSAGNARAFHLVTFLVAAGAVVLQLVLVIKGGQHLGDTDPDVDAAGNPDLGTRLVRFCSYLTIWFNCLVAGTSALLAADPARQQGRAFRALRLDALVLAVGGGVVHWFLLRPLLDLHGADLLADKLLHIVVPLLCLVGWLVFGPRGLVAPRDVGAFLVVPVGWLAYTLVRGAVVDWYPYPFVDVGQHGLGVVLLNAVAISALMLALAFGAMWLDRRLPGEEPAPISGSAGRSGARPPRET
jgi:hypothetical protein